MGDTDSALREIENLESLQLRRPFAVVGFGGWIDAGFAATGAVKFLVEHLSGQRVAELDPEPFYSFTDTRPRVSHPSPGDASRSGRAPSGSSCACPKTQPHDLVLFTAPEPNLRWRAFSTLVLDVFQKLGVETLVSLGAVLAPVHHRAQPPLRGWATTDVFALAAAPAPDRLGPLRRADRHHDDPDGRGARPRLAGLQSEHVVAQLPDRYAQPARVGRAAAHGRRGRRHRAFR